MGGRHVCICNPPTNPNKCYDYFGPNCLCTNLYKCCTLDYIRTCKGEKSKLIEITPTAKKQIIGVELLESIVTPSLIEKYIESYTCMDGILKTRKQG